MGGTERAITVRHVGTFAISKWKLGKMILKLVGKMKRIRKSGKLSEEKKKKILENCTDTLSLALKHRNTIATEYAENFGNI